MAKLTQTYLDFTDQSADEMLAEINTIMPKDCQYSHSSVALWATGLRVPRPRDLSLLILLAPDARIVTHWAQPIRKIQLEALDTPSSPAPEE